MRRLSADYAWGRALSTCKFLRIGLCTGQKRVAGQGKYWLLKNITVILHLEACIWRGAYVSRMHSVGTMAAAGAIRGAGYQECRMLLNVARICVFRTCRAAHVVAPDAAMNKGLALFRDVSPRWRWTISSPSSGVPGFLRASEAAGARVFGVDSAIRTAVALRIKSIMRCDAVPRLVLPTAWRVRSTAGSGRPLKTCSSADLSAVACRRGSRTGVRQPS